MKFEWKYFLIVIGMVNVLFLTGCDWISEEENTSRYNQGSTANTETSAEASTIVTGNDFGVNIRSLVLTVDKTSLNKDENSTVKVMAELQDGSKKDVTEDVVWEILPKDAVIFENGKLTAKKDVSTKIKAKIGALESNVVDLTITWTVNGHELPPEPDKALNDSTLLGVDVNGNGVRDDVERLTIIEEAKNSYFPKIWTALSLQYAWSRQKMIENPTLDSRKFLEDSSACREYFIEKHTHNMNYKDYREWRKTYKSILGIKKGDILLNR